VDLQLAGRVVAITGGTAGVGVAAVRRFLEEGASVALCARSAEQVAAVVTELGKRYGAAHILGASANVVAESDVVRFRDAVAERFGKTDVLVLNAGQARRSSFGETDDAAWREEIDLKFFGMIRPVRAFEALLRASDAASIISISSVLAKQPDPHLAATAATRAGTLNLARTLSLEFAPAGIRVNSLLLGVLDSGPQERAFQARVAKGEAITRDDYYAGLAKQRGVPLGRVGRSSEIAAAIAFLASPLSRYTTGAAIEMAGGAGSYV
jgi:NAD(P)-dependent dehydrogenase (short-subunit alcohol dehydrogenase family)